MRGYNEKGLPVFLICFLLTVQIKKNQGFAKRFFKKGFPVKKSKKIFECSLDTSVARIYHHQSIYHENSMQQPSTNSACWEDNIDAHPALLPHHAGKRDARYCPTLQTQGALHKCVVGSPILGIPPEMMHITKPVLKHALSSVGMLRSMASAEEGNCLYTWKCLGSSLVTISKVSPTTTVIWQPENKTMFTAVSCAALGPGCPVGTSFLAQIVMDRDPLILQAASSFQHHHQLSHKESCEDDDDEGSSGCGAEGGAVGGSQYMLSQNSNAPDDELNEEDMFSWNINILIMDVISIGGTVDFTTTPCPAQERYRVLMDLEDPARGVIVSQCVRRQWAGQLDALMNYHKDEASELPHVIDCFYQLGPTNPLELRLVKVSAS